MKNLTTCPDCNAWVSKRANACPKCGHAFGAFGPAGKDPRRRGCFGGCLSTVFSIGIIAFFWIYLLSPASKRTSVDSLPAPNARSEQPAELLSEVRAFVAQHDEYGAVVGTQATPNWAKGPRQRVEFSSGRSLLFYLKDGRVVTVYDVTAGEERRKIWGEFDKPDGP